MYYISVTYFSILQDVFHACQDTFNKKIIYNISHTRFIYNMPLFSKVKGKGQKDILNLYADKWDQYNA